MSRPLSLGTDFNISFPPHPFQPPKQKLGTASAFATHPQPLGWLFSCDLFPFSSQKLEVLEEQGSEELWLGWMVQSSVLHPQVQVSISYVQQTNH